MFINKNFLYKNVVTRKQPLCHDNQRCYCQDTIQHLKVNFMIKSYEQKSMVKDLIFIHY